MDPHSLLTSQQPTIHNTLGAALLGLVGASLIFGVSTLQVYWYYHYYPGDTWLHKCSVGILWSLDAIHLAVITHALYTYAVKFFGNEHGLSEILWSIKLQVSLNVVVVLMVHCLYALRVWRLGGYHHGILGYFVAFTVAGGSVIGIVLAFRLYAIDNYSDLDSISWIIVGAFATATSIDFMIAMAMCYYLGKSKDSSSRLSSRISSIMQYTLSSGLLTSACSLSAIFTYVLLPHTFIFLGIDFLLTKLYVVSFFAMLNARKRQESAEEGLLPTSVNPSRVGLTSSFWSAPPPLPTLHTPENVSRSSSMGNWETNYPRPMAI